MEDSGGLFYLLGAIRDGSLPKCKAKKEVSLAADPSREWLGQVALIASRHFSIPNRRFKIYEVWDRKSKAACYRLKLYSKSAYEYFRNFYEPGDQANWETPEAVKADVEVGRIKEYIAGFYDAEGGCRNAERFKCGISKTLQCWASIRCKHFGENEPLLFVQKKLSMMGISSNLYDSDELVLTGKENLKRFYEQIPLKHPRKKNELKELLLFFGALSAEA